MAAGLLAAAVAGGAVAIAGAALVGVGDNTTTVREVLLDRPTLSGNISQAGPLSALTLRDIYRKDAPGVVQVTSTTKVKLPRSDWFGNSFGLPGTEVQQSLGSGFVIDKAGHIVTNYHVVGDAQTVHVSFSNSDSMKARDRRQRPVDRRRPAQGRRELARAQAARRSATPTTSRSATRSPPSATRSATTAASAPASSARFSARSPPPDGSPIDRVIQTDAAAQPRQLRRPAAQRAGPGDRRQLGDRRPATPAPREHRHRLRDSDQHRSGRRRAAQGERPGRPPVLRCPRPPGHHPDGASSSSCPVNAASSSRRVISGQRRRAGRAARRVGPGRRRGRELSARRRPDRQGGRRCAVTDSTERLREIVSAAPAGRHRLDRVLPRQPSTGAPTSSLVGNLHLPRSSPTCRGRRDRLVPLPPCPRWIRPRRAGSRLVAVARGSFRSCASRRAKPGSGGGWGSLRGVDKLPP